jgi:hypothetical protein
MGVARVHQTSLRVDSSTSKAPCKLCWGAIVAKEIDAETAIENCRALIKQIKARLSAEKPFVSASSAAELLVHLESAASALKRSLQTMPGEALN